MAKIAESSNAGHPAVAGLPDAPLCSRAQVLAAYGGKSVSWLYEGMAEGRIPRPVRIGPNSVAWVTDEIRKDIASKIAAGPVPIRMGMRRRKQLAPSAPEAA
jgi:predicted DNA-binding transcriptional regulator AlpA